MLSTSNAHKSSVFKTRKYSLFWGKKVLYRKRYSKGNVSVQEILESLVLLKVEA